MGHKSHKEGQIIAEAKFKILSTTCSKWLKRTCKVCFRAYKVNDLTVHAEHTAIHKKNSWTHWKSADSRHRIWHCGTVNSIELLWFSTVLTWMRKISVSQGINLLRPQCEKASRVRKSHLFQRGHLWLTLVHHTAFLPPYTLMQLPAQMRWN